MMYFLTHNGIPKGYFTFKNIFVFILKFLEAITRNILFDRHF